MYPVSFLHKTQGCVMPHWCQGWVKRKQEPVEEMSVFFTSSGKQGVAREFPSLTVGLLPAMDWHSLIYLPSLNPDQSVHMLCRGCKYRSGFTPSRKFLDQSWLVKPRLQWRRNGHIINYPCPVYAGPAMQLKLNQTDRCLHSVSLVFQQPCLACLHWGKPPMGKLS